MGQVDELNSLIGLMMTEALPAEIHKFLTVVQHTLFDLGGELSLPGHTLVSVDRVEAVENMLDELNGALAPLEEFILPGGTRAAALVTLHEARAEELSARCSPWTTAMRSLMPPASMLTGFPTFSL